MSWFRREPKATLIPGDPIGSLKARWIAEKAKLRPGAPPEEIAAFEARHGVVLPPTLRALVGAVDGLDEMDDALFRFRPLAEVVPAREYRDFGPDPPRWSGEWFIFADFLIDSYAYVVRLTPDPADAGPVAYWDYDTKLFAGTPTFEAFLEQYLTDPDHPLGGEPIEGGTAR